MPFCFCKKKKVSPKRNLFNSVVERIAFRRDSAKKDCVVYKRFCRFPALLTFIANRFRQSVSRAFNVCSESFPVGFPHF